MAAYCNNSNSSSQYPSVCCVHNTESQPLLGYHSGHHASGSSQYQHQVPPPSYYVDMSDNNKSGHCTSSHAPVQQQCHCQQHYHNHHHHRHHSDNQSDCSRSSRQKDTTRCGGILIGLFIVFFFIFASFINSDSSRPSGPWNAASGSTTANVDRLDLLSNDSNNLNFDRCRDNAIYWDGPSTFTTEVKNFRLKIGQGNIFSRVNISTGPVALPTLHILGEVSPYEDDMKNRPAASHEEKINIDYLGLHVEIIELDNQFDAQVWYDNREVVDPRDGQHYRACARLFFEVILPESFTSYGSVTIDGPVVVINAQNLENVKFDRLHFGFSVGEISTLGRIHSDIFDARSNTGRIRVEAVQVATAGRPLDIQVSSITGGVQLTAETTDVDASEENHHKVHVSTKTGRIELTVQPSTSSSTIDTKHGNLDISTIANTGSIDTTIVLASQDQILTLISKTKTGSIRNHISDAFLGHFALSTKWGSTRVEPAEDSKSTITYEKLNAREKIGTKTLEGAVGVTGLIESSTVTGSTGLEFTN